MIPPALQASARAAYRDLIRASSSTFTGDERVLKGDDAVFILFRSPLNYFPAFRCKIRNQNTLLRSETNPKTYEENVKLAREIAQVLRKNVVQAVQVSDAGEEDKEMWSESCIL